MTAKVYNQNHRLGDDILSESVHHDITSLACISAKIDTFPDGPNHYMRTGRDAALAGAEMFNALQRMDKHNALRPAWQVVTAAPVADPTRHDVDPAQPSIADQRAAIKGLFVQPAQGQGVIEALHTNGSYNYGDPTHADSRGFYAQGQDFLLWDRHGRGSGLVDGRWIAFSRDEVALRRNDDHTLNVDRVRGGQTERLLQVTKPTYSHLTVDIHRASALHYGERSEAVAALQTELSRLGYTNRDGHALRADGDFGKETQLAVEVFQRDRRLTVDGVAGPHTRRAIQAATYVAREETVVRGGAHAPLQACSDTDHPLHPLYAKLEGLFPTGTSEARLAQATTACHKTGIEKPEDLGDIYGYGDTVSFMPNSLFARMAQMDVGKPAPAVQQSVQQVQQLDRQQQMQAQQGQMQEQPISPHGPALYR